MQGYIKEGIPAEYSQTTWCANMAIDFIEEQKGSPWFFSYNCFAPHHPFDPPADYLARYNPENLPTPKYKPNEANSKTTYQRLDSEFAHSDPNSYHVAAMTDLDKQQVTAAYYAMVDLIDYNVGRMVAALNETEQLNNTIVIFMSDHGEMLGDHGIYLKGPHFYEEAIRVPLIFSWPGQFKTGLKVDGLTELIDITPTLLDAAGLSIPQFIQGKTLLPILSGKANPNHHRNSVFSEYYNAWSHKHSYGSMHRTNSHKMIVYHGTDQGELYGLDKDPEEEIDESPKSSEDLAPKAAEEILADPEDSPYDSEEEEKEEEVGVDQTVIIEKEWQDEKKQFVPELPPLAPPPSREEE